MDEPKSLGRTEPVASRQLLQVIHQIADMNTEGFRHPQQSVQTDPLFSALNFPNVNRMQVGFFGQPFLADASLLAAVANGVTENFELARARHGFSAKQDRIRLNTPNMGLFLSCTISRTGVKTPDAFGKRFSEMAGIRRFMKEKAKILVMDNQTPMAMMMVSLLTQAGFEVTATHNSHKGFELAAEYKFDLIVLDANLPGINGFELCRELKQRHISYNTPIVFVSNFSSIENQQRAFELGAADFIEKPFAASDFVARILSQLEETTLA